MTRRIAVAIARRPARARFPDAPIGGEAVTYDLRPDERVRLSRRTKAAEYLIVEITQRFPRAPGIDHGAAQTVCGSARHGEERGSNQPTRRRFGNGDGLAA